MDLLTIYLIGGLAILLGIGIFSDERDWLPALLCGIFWPIVLLVLLYCRFQDWRRQQ